MRTHRLFRFGPRRRGCDFIAVSDPAERDRGRYAVRAVARSRAHRIPRARAPVRRDGRPRRVSACDLRRDPPRRARHHPVAGGALHALFAAEKERERGGAALFSPRARRDVRGGADRASSFPAGRDGGVSSGQRARGGLACGGRAADALAERARARGGTRRPADAHGGRERGRHLRRTHVRHLSLRGERGRVLPRFAVAAPRLRPLRRGGGDAERLVERSRA